MNMKRLLSLILAFVLVLGMIPVPTFATEGEEIPSVDVVLSLSTDEHFMVGPESGAIMAMKDISVPYFDLALYGLEEYYFVSESYGDDGDGLPGSDLEPGTPEYAYGKVTLLHLYIYALEVFYCGIDPEEAGKGYLYNEGLIGTEVFSISGGVGSSFMNQFWGGDCNLNYYVNYEYPLASEGWGATADQILLRDGDIITLGHFTGWSFYGDSYSIFNYITADNVNPVKGEEINLTLYYAGANMGNTSGTAQNLNTYCLDVYYAPVNDIPSEYVTDWEYIGTADENGQLVVDTSVLDAGEYIFAVAGQYGVDYSDEICSTPGGMILTVTGGSGSGGTEGDEEDELDTDTALKVTVDEGVTINVKAMFCEECCEYEYVYSESNATSIDATINWACSIHGSRGKGNLYYIGISAVYNDGYVVTAVIVNGTRYEIDPYDEEYLVTYLDEYSYIGENYNFVDVVLMKIEAGAMDDLTVHFETQKVDTHSCVFNKEVANENYLATEATCTEAATYYYSCECGEKGTETFAYGDALGHTEVIDAAIAPTCTESGLTEGKHCSVCEEVLVAQTEVDALGHDYVDGICTRCGEADPDYVAPVEPVDTVIYTGSDWPFSYYYIATLTLTGPEVAYIDGTTVYLDSKTAQDAELTLTAAAGGRQSGNLGVNWNDEGINTMTYTTSLVDGVATVKIYAYKAQGAGVSRSGTKTFTFRVAEPNETPALADGVFAEVTEAVTSGAAYEVDLGTIFADADGDALSYTVSINGAAAVSTDAAYSYLNTVPGTYVLMFTATDGKTAQDRQPTYTVTLTVKNSEITYDVYVTVPEGVAPAFYAVNTVSGGTVVKGDALTYVDGVVKVPENITRIMWEADGLVGTSAPVSAGAALELVNVSFEAILDSGEIDEQAAILVSDSEGVNVSGTAADTYLLPALAGFTYRATASGSNAGKYNPGQLTGQTPATGKVTIPLILKHFTVIAPAGSVVSAGTLSGSFAYSFAEAIKVENVDDTVVYKFAPLSGNAFIRVQNPDDDAVTYWDYKSSKADGQTITVTEEMLFMNDAGTDGEFNADTVYRNFEYYSFDLGDIYMNINNQGYIDLDIGEVKALNMFRNWQAINSFSNDKIAIPDFEYEIINIEGDNVVSIVPDANNTGAATMTATGEGTAIVLVTYDAMYSEITATGSLGGAGGANRLSAIWPDRTGVFVVSVGKDGTAIQSNMTCNGAIFDAEHSPQFYHGNEGAVVSFIPEEGVTVTVNRSTVGEKKLSFGAFTDEGVTVNAETGEVTVSGLTTGRHIIRLEKDGVAAYQVVTATQTTVTMTDSEGNALSLEEKLEPGQSVTITVTGLTNPAEKFATKYNFNCQITYKDQFGNCYSNTSGATYGKYDFSSIPQVVTVTIPEDWTESTLTLNGFMKMGGFAGDGIGSHRKVNYGDNRGMGWGSDAGMELGTLPEIVLNIAVPHEHSYEAVVTAPTCTEGGFTTYTCTICGDSYIADETAALGHTEEVIPAVAATCTETGLTEGKVCTVCGEITVQQQVVDALGHDFAEGTCTRCGEADPDYVTVIATGWSGYTTWELTSDGKLTFSPTDQKENGQTNLKNYWKVNGVLTLPWGDYAERITKVVIEEGIHDIGQMAFYELPNLREVVLPASIVEIRNYAFKNCKSLTTINLDGVDFIREGAFYGCSALENVTFAKNVVIEDWAFSRTDITLP